MMLDASRRQMFGGMAALSAFALLSGCDAAPASADLRGDDGAFFSAAEMIFLAALCDTMVPVTDSPGALAGKVPETLQALLTSWAGRQTRGRWRTNLGLLQARLDNGGAFAAAPAGERTRRLAALDAQVFAAADHPLGGYHDIKSTIIDAYYRSEPGATQELRYTPVPGAWQGIAPLGRNWAIDGQ